MTNQQQKDQELLALIYGSILCLCLTVIVSALYFFVRAL